MNKVAEWRKNNNFAFAIRYVLNCVTHDGNAAFFRWWGVGVFPILDIFKGPRSNPLHFLVTSPSISLNGSRRQ